MTRVTWNNKNFVPAFAGLLDDLVSEVSAPFTGRVHHGSMTMPRINVLESKDNFKLEVAAPGLTREQFSLSVEEDVLTIAASTASAESDANVESSDEQDSSVEVVEPVEKYTRREFNYSSFKRTFTLPENVDSDSISASYENGILVLTLPKMAKVAPRAIEISVG